MQRFIASAVPLLAAGAVLSLVPASAGAQPVPRDGDRDGDAMTAMSQGATDTMRDGEGDEVSALSTDEQILVEGEAPWEPRSGSQRAVTQADLAATPRRSADELLRLVPGLHIAQHAAEGKAQHFFLRGFDAVHGADLAVSVGGVPINEASNVHGHGYVDIGFVIPEVVQELASRKGAFEVDQGDFANAGSVDFSLGVASERRGNRLSYEAGTTNRHRVLGLLAPATLAPGTFLAVEATSDNGFGTNRASRRATALGQYRAEATPLRFVEVMAAAYGAEFGEPGVAPADAVADGALDFYGTYADRGRGQSDRLVASARAHDESPTHVLDGRLYAQWRRLSLLENFTGFLLYPDAGDARDQSHRFGNVGATVDAQATLARSLSVVAHAQGRGDWLAQSERQVDAEGRPWRTNSDLDARIVGGAAGLAARLRFGPWRAELGGRVDAQWITARERMSERGSIGAGFAAASPRARLSVALGELATAHASYGHGIRSPEARAVAADEASEFASSRSSEMGLSAEFPRARIAATGFATWIDSEVLFDHLAGTSLTRDATRRFGAEVAVAGRPTDWLDLRGDLTLVHARFVDSGDPIPGAPSILGRLEARVRHGDLSAGVLATGMGPRDLAYGARSEAFFVADAIVSYRFDRIAVGLQLDNVFNSQWREAEYQFASRFDTQSPASQLPRRHFAPGRPFGARLSLTARL